MEEPQTNPEPLLKVEELSHWLNISPGFIRSHLQPGCRDLIPAIRLGSEWRFDRQSIEQWIRHRANFKSETDGSSALLHLDKFSPEALAKRILRIAYPPEQTTYSLELHWTSVMRELIEELKQEQILEPLDSE